MNRRGFLAGALGALSTAQGKQTMQFATLGRTGARVSRLGFGCYFIGTDGVSQEAGEAMLERAVELGVTYLDTAPNYGRSEGKMGPVMPRIRDKVFLVSKTEEYTYEGTWKLLRQSLKRLRTDHLDLVHLHSLGNLERFPDIDFTISKKGALAALLEAKKQGAIRFIGCTGHNGSSRFGKVLDTGEIDVVMNAVNYVARHVYNFEGRIWAAAAKEGIGLVAMKVLGGVKQDKIRVGEENCESAIRYALSLNGATTAVIGMRSIAEVEKNAAMVSRFTPLTKDESQQLWREGQALAGTQLWGAAYGEPVV